ncbi:TPM domain-containing protein [Pseudonocardia sp. H11422]|uniref:TPM domain-containing protein n=1 Tax=Pseudonocardia sp. H11422 TaxID=2835866 RepID=UPI001BDC8467|nr:TPM domain-containing protein [Pseudonocardia sp. H11422]
MRRLLIASAVALVLLVLGGATPALADPPLRLQSQVTDRVGALGGDEAQVREAVDRLRTENGTQLFVVFVSSFDGVSGEDWAEEAAGLSQLGRRDVLLAVAVDDRAYGVSVDTEYPLSNTEIDDITARDVEPRLAAGDWAGAAVAMADGLRTGASGGGGPPVGVLLGGAALLGGGAYVLSRRRRRKASAGGAAGAPAGEPQADQDEFADVPTSDLAYRASADLIELDDAVQTSEQELGLAKAQFGDEAVGEFRRALDQSRADLLRAFALRQKLDDDEPEDEAAQRVLLADIVRLCRSADERLDAQSEAFDRLRDLERTAPEFIATLGPRLDEVRARVPDVTARSAVLRERYAAGALAPIADNVDQARQRLDVAATEIDEARTALTAGRRGESVVSGRAAEEAMSQAVTLLDGVARLETELAEAASRFAGARLETEQDLAEARAVLAAGDPGGLAPLVARAEAARAAADDAAAPRDGTLPDPLTALRQLDEAGVALDQGLEAARDAQDRTRRAAAVLDQALLAARSGVTAAGDFITTRRGAVGSEARTRLAEAQRHLEQAVAWSTGDPAAALREAQHADSLAQQALQLAQSDVSRWSPPNGPFQGGGSQSGVDLGSLILGGILLGGRGGGGFGGGFGGGGRRGGGGRSPGSFGGSGTRGRRGGGGRF